jgi:hypothetical protein
VLVTGVLDTMKDRDVAAIGTPDAYMQANMNDLVHIRVSGIMADLIMKCSPPSMIYA